MIVPTKLGHSSITTYYLYICIDLLSKTIDPRLHPRVVRVVLPHAYFETLARVVFLAKTFPISSEIVPSSEGQSSRMYLIINHSIWPDLEYSAKEFTSPAHMPNLTQFDGSDDPFCSQPSTKMETTTNGNGKRALAVSPCASSYKRSRVPDSPPTPQARVRKVQTKKPKRKAGARTFAKMAMMMLRHEDPLHIRRPLPTHEEDSSDVSFICAFISSFMNYTNHFIDIR